jgi:hypothetical protein
MPESSSGLLDLTRVEPNHAIPLFSPMPTSGSPSTGDMAVEFLAISVICFFQLLSIASCAYQLL